MRGSFAAAASALCFALLCAIGGQAAAQASTIEPVGLLVK